MKTERHISLAHLHLIRFFFFFCSPVGARPVGKITSHSPPGYGPQARPGPFQTSSRAIVLFLQAESDPQTTSGETLIYLLLFRGIFHRNVFG